MSLVLIELFHTHSEDFGRYVLGKAKKQANKQKKKTKITQCVIALQDNKSLAQ